MERNQIGNSDLYVSKLSLGCMSLGTDYKSAATIIDRALDMGINHLDTADLYNFGENERIIGEAIKHRRDQLILTTKVGNHFNQEKKDWFWDPSKKHIISSIKASLQRLQTDYIDLYLLHGGTINDPIDESIAAFEQLKQEGIIRAYGISSIRPNVIDAYVKHSNIDAVMLQYNILDRRPEEQVLDLLHTNQISVLARGPLAQGTLSHPSVLQRKINDNYFSYTYEDIVHIRQQLQKYMDKNKMNELAFRYVLYHPAVASAVFGASTLEQLNQNVNIDLSKQLSTTTYQNIQQLTTPLQYTNHRIEEINH